MNIGIRGISKETFYLYKFYQNILNKYDKFIIQNQIDGFRNKYYGKFNILVELNHDTKFPTNQYGMNLFIHQECLIYFIERYLK